MDNLLQNLTSLSQQLQSIDGVLHEAHENLQCKNFINANTQLNNAVLALKDASKAAEIAAMRSKFQWERVQRSATKVKASAHEYHKADAVLTERLDNANHAVERFEETSKVIDSVLLDY